MLKISVINSNKRLICLLATSCFSVSVFSAYGHAYVGASIAASFAHLGNRSPQIAYTSGALITDAYPLNNTNVSTVLGSINGGYEFTGLEWKPSIALGLGLYSTLGDYRYGGQVVETALGNASSTLYDYYYHINSTRLMAEIQLTWMLKSFLPFINLGVGSAWNRMNNYHEIAASPNGYVAVPPFQPHTNANLAYQAGFGLGKAFNFAGDKPGILHERVSVGYRYVYLGNTTFGARDLTYPYQLSTGRLETNDIYLSYSHLF